jgi:hypothetical protein
VCLPCRLPSIDGADAVPEAHAKRRATSARGAPRGRSIVLVDTLDLAQSGARAVFGEKNGYS